MRVFVILIVFCIFFLFPSASNAIVNPAGVPNNKVGVGILSPESEINDAKDLINTKGDWGWVTLVITKEERDRERWQKIFNELNENHLIPIVRLATKFEGGIWLKPDNNDAVEWADFLDSLYWPTKNRYIIVYNEVNRASEWGGVVSPSEYTAELTKTIDLLKSKSEDFFILPAPLDLALADSESSVSADRYFLEMVRTNTEIFGEIDGWASHSYPNPDFSASPNKVGRESISGYIWELTQIKKYTSKVLPVFISETGWKRNDNKEPTEETIAKFYEIAFGSVWKSDKVVAVTPFVLSYPDDLYFGFSFKKKGSDSFYKYYDAIKNLQKTTGQPVQDSKFGDLKINMPNTVIKNNPKTLTFTFKNVGNKIWNLNDDVSVVFEGDNANTTSVNWNKNEIFPGEIAEGQANLVFADEGEKNIKFKLNLSDRLITDNTYSIKSISFLSFLVENFKKNLTLVPALSSFVKY